jgi:molybdopterin/thiamine biosynthesis adenylyltransferase
MKGLGNLFDADNLIDIMKNLQKFEISQIAEMENKEDDYLLNCNENMEKQYWINKKSQITGKASFYPDV